MPANSRVFLKPFIGGLNTEASDTDDMVLNTSDELNCTILPEQMRGRRYGFNIEKDGQWIETNEDIVAHSLYHWNNVYENVNYIVVQINDKLYIYPDSKPHSQQTQLAVIDLSQYATLTLIEPVSMTSVSSSLFVVGRWIKPIVVEKEPDTNTFTISVNNPKFRDFNGVEDGYAVDYLPTNMTSRHLYNLINQGWDKDIYNPENGTTKNLLPDGPDDVLTDNGLFYTEYAAKYGTGLYPANNMQWFLGKQNSGKYNTTDLLNTYFGNTPAPKGHFIIDYLNRDRSAVSGIELDDEPAQTGINYDATLPVNNSGGLTKWELASRLYYGFNTPKVYVSIPVNYKISYDLPINVSGTLTKFSWGIKDFCNSIDVTGIVSPDPDTIVNNALRSNSNIADLYIFCQPFTMSLIGITGTGTEVVIDSQVIQLTGKMFTADAWDFTVTNTSSYSRYEIRLTWPNLDRTHKWLVPDSVTETLVINEINYDSQTEESYEGLPSSDLLRGAITDIESFGGRLFYLCGNTVLFSQTLSTNNKNFDKCYQEADPTSEEISDIVSTDGGMIQLLSLGRGKALKKFYRGIIVFGDEEVTGILSNYINLFSADSYDVIKITSAGLSSKYSVVETDNNILYWSNHGIYLIAIDENNNISSTCISINSIQNWYNNLPQFSRDNSVGYYDYANNRVYWFYPTTSVADKLDGCLIYDLTFNCFMPQYVDSGKVIRDLEGNYAGILGNYDNTYTRFGKTYKCYVTDDHVYNVEGELIGFKQDKYLTDCQESSSVYEIEPTTYLRAGGQRVIASSNKVLATSGQDAGYNRKSAGLFLISDGHNYSFGDFNDREFRDWDVSPYESYLVSRPITLGDTYFNKQTPVMQTLFKRTEEYKLKPVSDRYRAEYNLTPVIESDMWLLNSGRFKQADIVLDADDDTEITVTVKGYKEDNTYDTIATATGTHVECLSQYSAVEYKKFLISVTPTTNVRAVAVIERTNLTEHKFKGFEERTYSGMSAMTLYSDLSDSYRCDITTVDGILKDATVTFIPNIISFFIGPVTFSGTGHLNTTSKALTDDDRVITVTNANDNSFRNSYQMAVDNIVITGGGTLRGIAINYSITVYEPIYEDFVTTVSADYTTPSGSIIRMRWGWSVNPLSNRWDMLQNGYRPQKDFLHDDYVESRMHIKGRGKAFQVEIRNDDNKDFRLTGLNIITRSPQ